MTLSESEVAALMGMAIVFNGMGLVAWHRGFMGAWYPVAIALSVLAMTVDPLSVPGLLEAGAASTMLLGAFGLVVAVVHRHDRPVGRASR